MAAPVTPSKGLPHPMHPPPVGFRVRPDPGWRLAVGAIGAIASASVALWLALWIDAGLFGTMAVVGTLAAVGGGVAERSLRGHPGWLRWDGANWTWQAEMPDAGRDGQAASDVRAVFDWGSWMLLRLRMHTATQRVPQGNLGRGFAHQWLPVARRMDPAQWHGLRVAVHAGHRSPGATGGA